MIELFLKGLISALIGRVIKEIAGNQAASIYKAVTFFTSLGSVTDSTDLGIAGFQYGYQELSDKAIQYLINDIGHDNYDIETRKTGIYVARSRLISEKRVFVQPIKDIVVSEISPRIIPVREIPVRYFNKSGGENGR